MEHPERYQYLVDHQIGGKVTNYYRAAFFLLSATEEMFEKSKEYATVGIEFTAIKAKLLYHDQMYSVLVDIAENLYTAHDQCKITPRHIALLPPPYFDWVIQAMHLAAGNCTLKVVEDEFSFDFTYYCMKDLKQQGSDFPF